MKRVRHLVALLLACGSALAHATLITFDERPWQPDPNGDTSWYVDPVTTEYPGVVFGDGYLSEGPSPMNPSQSLLGGPFFGIQFTGTLPTWVSFNFTSTNQGAQATVFAYDTHGQFDRATTGGVYWGGEDVGFIEDKPFVANSTASFHSTAGITGLFFDTYSMTRNIGWIDNLYFGTVPPVPEPASIAMLAAGLVALGWARRRRG